MFHLFYTSHMRESAAHSRWYCAHARTNSFEFWILNFLSWDKGKTVSGSRPRTTRKRSVSQRPHSSAPRSIWNELTIVFHHSLWQSERAPQDNVTWQKMSSYVELHRWHVERHRYFVDTINLQVNLKFRISLALSTNDQMLQGLLCWKTELKRWKSGSMSIRICRCWMWKSLIVDGTIVFQEYLCGKVPVVIQVSR